MEINIVITYTEDNKINVRSVFNGDDICATDVADQLMHVATAIGSKAKDISKEKLMQLGRKPTKKEIYKYVTDVKMSHLSKKEI